MVKKDGIHFVAAKTKVERVVPADVFTLAHLKRIVGRKPSYAWVHKICKQAGIVPKSGRQSFITHQRVAAINVVSDPAKVDWLIKVACGHTTPDIGAVYVDLEHDMRRLFREHHYMLPLRPSLV